MAALGGPFASVFDVGSDVGTFAVEALDAWPGCRVVSFEPLREHPGESGDSERWQWHQIALGSAYGMATMERCVFSPSSSLLAMADLHREAFPYSDGVDETVWVRLERLDSYAYMILPPALLKIDVQGYELEVLRGAGNALALFAAVVVEVNHAELYLGAPSPEDLWPPLVKAGFRHHSRLEELRHPETDVLLQSDELWVKA